MPRIIWLLTLLAATGCSSYETGFLRYGDESLAARQVGAAVEICRRAPQRPHHELGEVFAVGRSIEDLEGVRQALLDRAAAEGADAVVLVRVRSALEDYGYYGHGHTPGSYYYPYWGWDCSPSYYRGLRSVVVLRGVAVAWTGPAPEGESAEVLPEPGPPIAPQAPAR